MTLGNNDGDSLGSKNDQCTSTVTMETSLNVPETIITNSETGNVLEEVTPYTERVKKIHGTSPPVLRRNSDKENSVPSSGTTSLVTPDTSSVQESNHSSSNNKLTTTIDIFNSNEISPEHILDHKRKRSNNHLYPPPLDEII